MTFVPNDVIARKYCFKASVRIVNRIKVPIGMFFAYGTKPTIARDVHHTGEQFCLEHVDGEYFCEEPQLSLFEECPVELTNDIFFQPFECFEKEP